MPQTYEREGAGVVVAGRSQATIDAAVSALRADGARAAGIACDVGDFSQVEALSAFALETFGKIDIWVNNAGLSAPYGPTAAIPTATFMKVVNTNIIGLYNGSVIALRTMVPQRSGKLINLLGRGDTAKKGVAFQNAYSASKTWVRSFTLALAEENKEAGIGIFAFNPGLVDTDMLRYTEAVPGFENRLRVLETVMRLWADGPDVAAQKALWLASSATDGKTGLMVNVLTRQRVVSGLLNEGVRRLMRRPAPDMSLDIQTIVPERL
ncbi:MAG: SDR family oxidoreductase [Chloroflexi bacterium]|nr:SDR family oxidoreductase [Chloroflexota bacterium]